MATATATVSVTLAQFDLNGTDVDFTVTRDAEPLATCAELGAGEYLPRGGTPLLDAVARFVSLLDARRRGGEVTLGLLLDRSGSMSGNREAVVDGVNEFLGGMRDAPADADDDGKVVAVIVTDGHENASREVDAEAVKKLIAEREGKGWTFIYLGANQDAWAQGRAFGLSGGYTGQTVNYVATPKGMRSGLAAAANRAAYYVGEQGEYPPAFASSASVAEDGAETDENVAAKPATGGYGDVGEALRAARAAQKR